VIACKGFESGLPCQGNACTVLEVNWVEALRSYVFRNLGARALQVLVKDDSVTHDLTLRPGETRHLDIRRIECPIFADFCDI
jgi:hypothetical protein